MAALSNVKSNEAITADKAAKAKAAEEAAPNAFDLAPGTYSGNINMYLQRINGQVYLRPGEVFSQNGKAAKIDPNNGYDTSKKRSKRTFVGVLSGTLVIR